MLTLFGPTDEGVPDVYSVPGDETSYDESRVNMLGPWAMSAGDVLTVTFTSAVRSAGGDGFDIYLKQSGAPAGVFAGSFSTDARWSVLAGGGTLTMTVPRNNTFYLALLDGGGGVTINGGTGTLHGLKLVSSALDPGGFCAYGTEPNPDAQLFSFVTGALLDAVGLLMGWGPLVILAMDVLIGTPVLIPPCDAPPVGDPLLTSADLFPPNFPRLLQAFNNALWHFYCRCTPAPPGSPLPDPFPINPLPPDLAGGQPAIVCDNQDICSSLNALQKQLDTMMSMVTYTHRDLILVQRQHVPFAYLPGTRHLALSGNGYLTVSGILGLSVTCTAPPGYLGREAGAPEEVLFLGHISLGTADGFERRVTLTHAAQIILDVNPSVTRVGYSLNGGVVADILELVREP